MTFRILAVDEWKNYPQIREEFMARNLPLPDPRFSMIAAAFMESNPPKLQGFLVCGLQFHAEPLVVFNPYAVRGLMKCIEEDLINRLGSPVQYFACVDPESRMEEMLESLGLEKMPLTLYRKVI